MKFHSLTNFEIDDFFHRNKIPQYGGCVSNDFFNNVSGNRIGNRFFIYNLENSDQIGSHWQYVDFSHPKYIVCFCSFGLPPNESIMNLAKKMNRTILYQNVPLQELTGNQCGYFCCYIGYQMHENQRTYPDILYNDFRLELNQQPYNIRVLSKFFKSHKI